MSSALTKPSPSLAARLSAGAGGAIFSCFSTCLIFITKHQQNSELNTFITRSSWAGSRHDVTEDFALVIIRKIISSTVRFENVLNIYRIVGKYLSFCAKYLVFGQLITD